MPVSIGDLRRDYALARLDESSVSADPLSSSAAGSRRRSKPSCTSPNAMTLATATPRAFRRPVSSC